VLSWAEFARARPDLAEAGRRLLYQFGVGLGFLATVRPDGSPRLHPMCPLVTEDALVGFLLPRALPLDGYQRSWRLEPPAPNLAGEPARPTHAPSPAGPNRPSYQPPKTSRLPARCRA
jgi:hypothetical protein